MFDKETIRCVGLIHNSSLSQEREGPVSLVPALLHAQEALAHILCKSLDETLNIIQRVDRGILYKRGQIHPKSELLAGIYLM